MNIRHRRGSPACCAGPNYKASRPIGDRWMFDLQARTWVQLPIRGLSPLPRFLFASTQYSPDGGAADQFLLFGGQTGALRCLLLLSALHHCAAAHSQVDACHC